MDLVISKLNNMINWLINDNILDKNHKLIDILLEYKSNSDELLKFIVLLNNISDSNGNISDWKISLFLKQYDIDILDFNDEILNKLKRYIRFFIESRFSF